MKLQCANLVRFRDGLRIRRNQAAIWGCMCGFCVGVVYMLLEHQGVSLIHQYIGRGKFLH